MIKNADQKLWIEIADKVFEERSCENDRWTWTGQQGADYEDKCALSSLQTGCLGVYVTLKQSKLWLKRCSQQPTHM